MPLLEVEGLTVRFGGLTALSEVSFAVEEGAIFGLIGPNGAGKTTLFNCVSRITRPDEGAIRFAGRDLLRVPPHALAGLGIARTFQNLELCRRLTALDNVLLGAHTRIGTSLWSSALGLPAARRREEAARADAVEALRLLGVEWARDATAGGLPFGVLKRVELARALVGKPRLLLLDEPASGLNAGERRELAAAVRRVRDAAGVTVLLVEHDMSLVMRLCDRMAVLDFGRKVAEGSPDQVQNDPAVIEAYLGEAQPVDAGA